MPFAIFNRKQEMGNNKKEKKIAFRPGCFSMARTQTHSHRRYEEFFIIIILVYVVSLGWFSLSSFFFFSHCSWLLGPSFGLVIIKPFPSPGSRIPQELNEDAITNRQPHASSPQVKKNLLPHRRRSPLAQLLALGLLFLDTRSQKLGVFVAV